MNTSTTVAMSTDTRALIVKQLGAALAAEWRKQHAEVDGVRDCQTGCHERVVEKQADR